MLVLYEMYNSIQFGSVEDKNQLQYIYIYIYIHDFLIKTYVTWPVE